MIDKSPPKFGNPLLVSLASFIVIVAGLRAAQDIVVPFLSAAFLTLLSLPLLRWFQDRRLPTWLAMLVITVLVILVGLAIVMVVGSSVTELQKQMPAYQERVVAIQTNLNNWLTSHGIKSHLFVDQQFFNADRVVSLFGGLLGTLGSLLNNALIILFTLVFMQLEAADLPAKLQAATVHSSAISTRLQRIQLTVWQYIRLKTRLSLLTGALVTAWLWLLGVHFYLLWGLLAFLFNFVPNIGSIIAAVPAILVAVLQPDTAGQPMSVSSSIYLACYTALGYFLINMVIGNVIEPRLMGSGMGLSTLVVFLSLVFWGWVLGPVGMVLSVPLTMIVKIVLDNSENLQWAAILLGPDMPAEPRTEPE